MPPSIYQSGILAASGNSPLGLALLGLVVLLILGGVWMSSVMDRRRRDALRHAAGILGLQFEESAMEARRQSFASLPLFNLGHSPSWSNEASGVQSRIEVRAFDFRYTRGHGKHRRTHRQSVIAVRLDRARVPQFALRRSHFGDRLAAMVGFDDINFDSHREFSKKWSLTSDQPSAARNFFRAELLDEFMNIPDVQVQGSYDWIIVFRPDKRTKPELLGRAIEEAVAIRDACERWGRARHQ